MSITREEFNRAFHEAVAMEFADIPIQEAEIDFAFSKDFLRKMDNLIVMQEDGIWKLLGMIRRYVAVIAIVILGVSISACGINQVITHLYGNVYEEMREEFYAGVTATEISYAYDIAELPEGFEKVSLTKDSRHIISVYQNEAGDEIYFLQDATADTKMGIMNTSVEPKREYVTRSSSMIRGFEVELYENEYFAGAIWLEDGYFMEIRYYGCEDIEDVKAIVETIE